MWMTDDGVSEAMVLALRAHWKRERRAKGLLILGFRRTDKSHRMEGKDERRWRGKYVTY